LQPEEADTHVNQGISLVELLKQIS